MDAGIIWLLIATGIPFAGAFLAPAIGVVSPKTEHYFSLFITLLSMTACLITAVNATGTSVPVFSLHFPLNFSLGIRGDSLSSIVALSVSLILFFSLIYSSGYLPKYKREPEYYPLVMLMHGGLLGVIFSSNLAWLFIFLEISGLAAWRMTILFRPEKDHSRTSRALLMSEFGSLCLLMGIVALYSAEPSADLQSLHERSLQGVTALFLLTGILCKAGAAPFSSWVTDTSTAPLPLSALINASLSIATALYIYARIFCFSATISPEQDVLVSLLAGLTALIGAGAALAETDIRRITAYSMICQTGFVLLGLSTVSRTGIGGGLLCLISGLAAHAGLIFSAGIIEFKAHTWDITKMGGLARQAPVTATVFSACTLAITGMPPFAGFFAKLMLFRGTATVKDPLISAIMVLASLLVAICFIRVFYLVFISSQKEYTPGEGPKSMQWSMVAMALTVLVAGLFIYYPSYYIYELCTKTGASLLP